MRIVDILRSLTESLVSGLYVGVIIWVVGEVAYWYMKSPAGAWSLRLSGLGREATLIMGAAWQVSWGFSLLWLALLSLIVWLWTTHLGKLEAGRGGTP